MICATTNSVDGKRVLATHGIVASQVVFGANVIRDLAANVLDVTGGRNAGYEQVFEDARAKALDELQTQAKQFGANAILGIRFDYHTLGSNGSMLMVAAYGTAVQLTKSDDEKRKDDEFARRDEAHYFVTIDSIERGPFSVNQLQELIQAGRIEPTYFARQDDRDSPIQITELLK